MTAYGLSLQHRRLRDCPYDILPRRKREPVNQYHGEQIMGALKDLVKEMKAIRKALESQAPPALPGYHPPCSDPNIVEDSLTVPIPQGI